MTPSSSDRAASENTRRRPWSRIFGYKGEAQDVQTVVSREDEGAATIKTNNPSSGNSNFKKGAVASSLTTIPSELLLIITLSLDNTDIRSLRLTSKHLVPVTTSVLFRKTRLSVEIPHNAHYCIKHWWYGYSGDKLPCNYKSDYIFKTHHRCPFHEYKSANRKVKFPLAFTLGPLLDIPRETWKVGLPRVIEYVQDLTIDISPEFRNRHYGSSYGKEMTSRELLEEFEKYALPLIFVAGNKIKIIRITMTTLPPAEPLSRIIKRVCDSAAADTKADIHVTVVVTVNNKLPLILSSLHGLSSIALDIRDEHVPDLSNLPTWTSPENIVSMRRSLEWGLWKLAEERCPKMKLPDRLGEIIDSMRYYEVLQAGGRKPVLYIGPK